MKKTLSGVILAVFLTMCSSGNAQNIRANSYNFEPMLQRFSDLVNAKTGLTSSFLGGRSAITSTGANTYDMSLWAMGTPWGSRVISTYSLNSTTAATQDMPQTLSRSYTPDGGVLSFIRLTGMEEYGWWNTWEWSVKAGENAWIGLAAVREYVQTGDAAALSFARQRADFLLTLQDIDGALRMGPRGQYFPYLEEGWWSIKSTENNESALYFLDQLYLVTEEPRYKKAADHIYDWLMDKMLDLKAGMFRRGMIFPNRTVWRMDSHFHFSPDTLTFAPLERMLADTRFGENTVDRLNTIERMMKETEKKVGVTGKGGLVGLSFSAETKRKGIVSPEWTAQYVLLCRHMAEAYHKAGLAEQSQRIWDKGEALMEWMKRWYVQNNYALPYALYYRNGYAAQEVPTGHGWSTPDSKAALSSTIYFGFAAKGFDPLRDLLRP